MKDIKVLGAEGCKTCTNLTAKIKELTTETDIKVEKITDVATIMGYGVMSSPSVVVDGEVKVSGRVPTDDEIKEWIAK